MSDYPYPGLRPFKRHETDIFFGRERQTSELLDRLDLSNFLAVLGPSGCGKSSLVRTGLMAGLESGLLAKAGTRWATAVLRPGNDPFGRLAKALLEPEALGPLYTEPFASFEEARAFLLAGLYRSRKGLLQVFGHTRLPAGTRLLVVVDQFEELFRYHQKSGNEDAAAFVDLLLESSRHDNVYVVLTMRSDFLGDCALYRGLPEAINRGLYLTPRLDRQQLHEVIAYPAKVFGGRVEPVLVNQLVNTVGNDPDQLPLLQHTLMRLWQKAAAEDPVSPQMTLAAYEKLGGLQQALSDHAEFIYTSLDPEQQRIAEIMFRALTEREVDGRDIRRPVLIKEVAELAAVDWQPVVAVVEAFRARGRHFLTPALDEELDEAKQLDISHESLIRQWQRLQGWVASEAEMAEEYRRLAEESRRYWAGIGSELQSPALENFLDWRKRFNPGLVWARRYGGNFQKAIKYLNKSADEKAKAARKEAEINRKIRRGLIVATVTACLALIAFFIALNQYRVANSAKRQALLSAKLAQGEKLKAQSSLHNFGLLLSEKAESEKRPLLSHLYMLHAMSKLLPNKDEGLYRQMTGRLLKTSIVLPVFRTPNGDQHDSKVTSVAFSPDGKILASGSDETVAIWNLASGDRVSSLKGHKGFVNSVVFSPDGKTLASGSEDKTVAIWDLADGERISTLKGHQGPVTSVVFSPDGKTLASGSEDKTVSIWDLVSGDRERTLEGHKSTVFSVAFSPDGKTLASGSYDGTVATWDLTGGERVSTLKGHKGSVNSVCFSPDGKTLASGSYDRTVAIWDLAGEKQISTLKGHKSSVISVAFSPDGNILASSSYDKTIAIWDLAGEKRVSKLKGHQSSVLSVAFSPDGKTLASGSGDKTVATWDLASEKRISTLEGHQNSVLSVAFSPDGKTFASGSKDKTVAIWDLASGKRISTLEGHQRSVVSVAFSPDGKTLATGSSDKTVAIWDLASGEQIMTFKGQKYSVLSLALSPDGKTLATGSSARDVAIWDLASGEQIMTLKGHKYSQ